jgi:prepilin peptidase CpaA
LSAVDWQALNNLGVILAVTAASFTDLRWGKVYNFITVPALVAGLTLNALAGGWSGLALSVQGIFLGVALLLTTLLLGQYLGGGDLKLLAALGALRGPLFLLHALLVAVVLGGIIAVGVALARGALGASLRRLGWSLYGRFAFGLHDPPQAGESLRFPYAVAIAGGAFAALCWRPW